MRKMKPGHIYQVPSWRTPIRKARYMLGLDPLTLRERFRQVDTERADWKRWLGEERTLNACLREDVRLLVKEYDRAQVENDGMDWTAPLIDVSLRAHVDA